MDFNVSPVLPIWLLVVAFNVFHLAGKYSGSGVTPDPHHHQPTPNTAQQQPTTDSHHPATHLSSGKQKTIRQKIYIAFVNHKMLSNSQARPIVWHVCL